MSEVRCVHPWIAMPSSRSAVSVSCACAAVAALVASMGLLSCLYGMVQGSRGAGIWGGVGIGHKNGCLWASWAIVVCVGVQVFPVPFPHGIGQPGWSWCVIQIS